MSLSSQISVIGSLPSAGSVPGGGGATTDAGDLTTGTLAAARLPGVLANVDTQAELLSAAAAAAASHTHAASDIASGTVGLARGGTNADLSATGGSGHVLKQSSAGANITVGAIAAGDLPTAIDAAKIANGNVSNTEFQYLDGVTSVIQTQLDGKLNDTGDTITGALSFGGSISSAGASTRNIHGNGGTTDLYANAPTGGVWGVSVNGTAQATVGVTGLQFPTSHTAPSSNVCAIFRNIDPGTIVQGPTSGYGYLTGGSNVSPAIAVCGTGSGFPGAILLTAAAVSLAASGTRTVRTSATTLSGEVLVINTTDGKRATFSVENGTPVKIEGDASFVAGAPGASQIGLELSSTTLRINNGYAGAKLIAFISRLA